MTQYRLTVAGTFPSGRPWSFRQHYSSASSLGTILADWAAAWTTAWNTSTTGLKTVYPVATVLTQFTAATLVGTPYRETTKSISDTTLAGTNTSDGLPENVAIVVSRRTANVGARNRGRTFLPAPGEDTQTDGEMDATTTGHVSTSIDGVRTAMTGAGHTPVIYNTKVSSADPTVQTNKTITAEETDRVLRSQRRRQEKRKAVYV